MWFACVCYACSKLPKVREGEGCSPTTSFTHDQSEFAVTLSGSRQALALSSVLESALLWASERSVS
jgi:hypothetical protein